MQAGAVSLHVADAGAGDPIVLLHGWPQHWYCWRRIIPRLVGEHRVLCPDLRGSGWSDAPRSSYAKNELADDVIALLVPWSSIAYGSSDTIGAASSASSWRCGHPSASAT